MTAERENITAGSDEDELNTTAPQSEKEAWQMPEPVFQCTSGKLPQGFEREHVPNGVSEILQPEETPIPASDDHVPAYSSPEPAPQNPALKLILVVLGVVAMVAFLVAFLTLVYFLFLR